MNARKNRFQNSQQKKRSQILSNWVLDIENTALANAEVMCLSYHSPV